MSQPPGDRGAPLFPPLPARPDLPALEHEMLARWREGKVFERSLEQTARGPLWTFYEGPPTANGIPGVHHVEARVFKDVFPRFKTMQGFHVPRQGGWDCHGLPVEVAVEKELGISGKKDIEAYGIAEFNARCRESVQRHVDAFEELTERMGYWIDLSGAYWTMNPSYVESVWWSLKEIFNQGLLVRDFRISPYCPRCGTPLSDHELGQPDVYQTVGDPSVTVRFPLRTLPDGAPAELAGANLLVWTTTPWTLVSNTAVAVHPDETYVLARHATDGERVVVAAALAGRVLGEGWDVLSRFPGSRITGASYGPPFGLINIPDAHIVVPGRFVTTEDGTGLVHLAPAFGPDDMEAGRLHGLPVVNPIRPDGRFDESVPLVGGLFFKDADARLVADLAERGLLFRSEIYEHSYPHCWRCGTPLLYYALPSWYIRTTRVKDKLLAENERTNWQPPTIKHGRYGEWLRNNVDWALSRTRYWGTPLPLWICGEDHVTCVGSLAELSELAGRDLSGLDPHRPQVDDVVVDCPQCGSPARRVPDVIDAWYDSGSMPFGQHGAPWRNQAEFERAYPAQFICEAIDQTRGWFYSLMAVGTLVFGRSSYENVVCLGLILDEHGVKMSKHLGNVIEPIPLMDQHGADALRWFFTSAGSPWSARRLGHGALEEIVRKVLLTYWNTASFFVLYANATAGGSTGGAAAGGSTGGADAAAGGAGGAAGGTGAAAGGTGAAAGGADVAEGAGQAGGVGGAGWLGSAPPPAERPLLDRWILGELHGLTAAATAGLEAFDTSEAGRRLAAFIDDLSNWYVRRSRRRFWEGPGTPEGAAAFATLHECLRVLSQLMAPFTPFIADHVWGVLSGAGDPDSVHLTRWPSAELALVDERLSADMALARRLVELGRSARASASVRTRQPLGRGLVSAAGFGRLPAELVALVAEELNVHSLDALAGEGDNLVDHAVKPNFRSLGRRFGASTPSVAAAISAADPAWLAREFDSFRTAALDVAGETVTLEPDDVIITQTPRSGWAVATDGGETVALEVTITPELRREGLAREMVRLVQDERRNAGLDISDRIELWWQAGSPELAEALTEHGALIAGEVLAVRYVQGRPDDVGGAGGAGGAAGTGGTTGGAGLAGAGVVIGVDGVAGADGARLREHSDGELGLTFWLRRVPTAG